MPAPLTDEPEATPERRWARPGVTTFTLAVATAVGLVLVFVVPPFAGIDESGHFARSYQMSTGRLVPVETADPDQPPGGGACLPSDVAGELDERVGALVVGTGAAEADEDAARGAQEASVDCAAGDRFVSFATFAWYAPVGYAPQVLGVGLGRALGFGPVGMLVLARLAVLATYLAGLVVGLRWSGASRWAIAVVGLLPIALFQAASVSPDGVTTALVFAVLGSALRMTTQAERPLRPQLVEAGGLCLALALCKPTYVLVGLAYAVPALARTGVARWWLLAPGVGGLAVSGAWQRSFEHLFVCDTSFFGVEADPDGQIEAIATGPHRFVGGVLEATTRYAGEWSRDLVLVGDRILVWPYLVVLAVLVAGLLLGLRLDGDGDGPQLGRRQISVLALLGVAGLAAVFAGWFVYCNQPGFEMGIAPSARLFVPFLPLLLVAAGQVAGRHRAWHPVGPTWFVGVAAFYLVWTLAIIDRF